MSKSYRKDLTGQRFGRLTVLEFVPDESKKTRWKCKCDCGNQKIIHGNHLLSGNTKSCGCLSQENAKRQGENNKVHNKCNTRLYSIFHGMKDRCYNLNASNYLQYGGRDIAICDEWLNDFQAFYDWAILNGYKDNLSIDRVDNDGNYEPSNCRWVDVKTQCRNRRSNIFVEYEGKMLCLTDVAKILDIPCRALQKRYKRGDRGEKLFRAIER